MNRPPASPPSGGRYSRGGRGTPDLRVVDQGMGFHDPHIRSEHPEDETEPWLVSYADLMTLLFGLFAMLFTYATFEDGKKKDEFIMVRKEVAKYFGGKYANPAEQVANKIKADWEKSPFAQGAEMKMVPDGIDITFVTNVLFGDGDANLQSGAVQPIEMLITLIQSAGLPVRVMVEGHTDDRPIHSALFPSNWELSAARACTIVRMFEKRGFPPDHIRAVGLGSSIPALPNNDPQGIPIPDNQAHNRRVVVKVYVTDPEGKAAQPAEAAALPTAAPASVGAVPASAIAPPAGK